MSKENCHKGNMTDEQIELFHDNVEEKLRNKLADLKTQEDMLREQLRELQNTQSLIVHVAMLTGEWWKLQGILPAMKLNRFVSVRQRLI